MADGDGDVEQIRLLTLTGLWRFQKYLHTVGGAALWEPIRWRTISWVAAVFGATIILAHITHLGWLGPALTLRFVLPGIVVWWAMRQVDAGASPGELALSWLRWAAATVRREPDSGRRQLRSRARASAKSEA